MKDAVLPRVLKSIALSAVFMAFFLLVFSLNAPSARAENKKKIVKTTTTTEYHSQSYSSPSSAKHAVSGAFGFYAPGAATYNGTGTGATTPTAVTPRSSGFFGIGAEYEYLYDHDLSFGALLRYYSASDTYGNGGTNTTEKTTALTVGGFAKARGELGDWEPYALTGLGIISPSYKLTAASGATVDYTIPTGFGVYLGVGVLYKINSHISAGVENLRMISISSNIDGTPIDDYMLKARYTLGSD